MKFLYGFAARHLDEQCAIRPDSVGRTLCGRDVAFMPAHDADYTPSNLHARCRDLIFGAGSPPRNPKPVVGVCPYCVGEVPVVGGRVGEHAQWVPSDGGLVPGSVACPGVGECPEVAG